MNLILPFTPESGSFSLSLNQSVLSLGSCFSSNLSAYLKSYKLEVVDNPRGILYNPLSIIKCLQDALSGQIDKKSIIERNGKFYYFHAHSSINADSALELVQKLASLNQSIKHFLIKADFLIITWGTAWVFEHLTLNEPVANCHKVPSNQFKKKLIDARSIEENMIVLLKQIHLINPDIKTVLTVSPVRHTKLGLSNNTIGKAELIKASTNLSCASLNIHYFESYEIVMDVLRDYRFFEEDLIHPNKQAVRYIIDQFSKIFFDLSLQKFVEEWTKVIVQLNHKPFNPHHSDHQVFLKKLKSKILQFEDVVDIKPELQKIENMIQ